jgi:DNA polymerase-3 subunit epsilon
MSWLTRLFRPRTELPEDIRRRLDAWRDLPGTGDATSLDALRLVVVDVETTGLDPRRDRLLAIGAVSVEHRRLRAGTGIEALLRHEETSPRESILVHGIGPQEQARGLAPEQALAAFLEYAGKCPLVAYHASFDELVLGRALRESLGVRLSNPFIDLAHLAPRLVPEARLKRASLDDWLDYFGLRTHVRHRAVYDCLATGELLLILLQRATAQGITTLGALRAQAEPPAGFSAGRGVGGA